MNFFGNDDDKKKENQTLPLLPLRDIIVFPHMVVPLFVGREKSIHALEEAMRNDKQILLATQIKAKTNDPGPADIYDVGAMATLIQLLRLPDGTVKVLIEGKKRCKINSYINNPDYLKCEVEFLEDQVSDESALEALVRNLKASFENYVKLNKRIPPEMVVSATAIEDPARLADTIIAHLSVKIVDKQKVLETENLVERLEFLLKLLQNEIEIVEVEKNIQSRVKKQMEKSQKEFYLNEQMQAIQKELGEREEAKSEFQELEDKLAAKDMPKEARDRVKKELKKLKMMSPMSAEATVVRNYIDWILGLPWNEKTNDILELKNAEEILDSDHHALTKPKERIIEFLAVQKLVGKVSGPILCLVGPPGVGKTSLANSIAKSMDRKFVRLSLGGVRDEAEIRGHRRTYIGAMPGKIIQALKKAGSSNPVILLDEIDKMSMDFRGDPSSALLEVLDPEQNFSFNDHYLDLDYDLTNVLFVCTANTLHGIPNPLKDRMEVIRIAGYTELEKIQIVRKHLLPKQIERNGLKEEQVAISDPVLKKVILGYTREAGVRNMEREVATICRKIAREVVEKGSEHKVKVTEKVINKYLGVVKFKDTQTEKEDLVGLTTGLAWTEVGGEVLTTEVSIMPGKGKMTLTGKLGDVMKESAAAAMTYVRTRAEHFGLNTEIFEKHDIHIHLPEGAIPKDGPSAGITLATSIVSAFTKTPVRADIAMTGEITLRGRVLPIGGLKEKLLAANRYGIKTVCIPKENEKDLIDVPKMVRKALEVIPVEHVDEVLNNALIWSKRETEPVKDTGEVNSEENSQEETGATA